MATLTARPAAIRGPVWKPWIPLALSVVIFFSWTWFSEGPTRRGENDFLAFYAEGRLLSQGKLYDLEATRRLHVELIGAVMPDLLSVRIPAHAIPFRLLAELPYLQGYWIYQSLSLAALCGFLWLLRVQAPELPYLAAISLPLLCAVGNGQDTAFLLLTLAAGAELLRRQRDLTAGLVLSLCAFKFHLFLLLPLALLLHRRWRVLGGGATGGLVLLAASFVVAGADWPRQYLAVLTRPEISPKLWSMGNLLAVVHSFGLAGTAPGLVLDAMLHVAAAGALLWIAWREPSTTVVLGFVILAGLLTGRHSYVADFALLLASYALLQPRLDGQWRRLFGCLLLWPFLYLGMVLGPPPYSAALPVAALGLLLAFALRRGAARDGGAAACA